jgi:hypothetical protein
MVQYLVLNRQRAKPAKDHRASLTSPPEEGTMSLGIDELSGWLDVA